MFIAPPALCVISHMYLGVLFNFLLEGGTKALQSPRRSQKFHNREDAHVPSDSSDKPLTYTRGYGHHNLLETPMERIRLDLRTRQMFLILTPS